MCYTIKKNKTKTTFHEFKCFIICDDCLYMIDLLK